MSQSSRFRSGRRLAFALPLLALAALPATPARAAEPFDLRPEITGQALFSCQNMTMSGNVKVDSLGVVGGATHGLEGHVKSNGNVTISGNVNVWGDVLAGPGKQVIRSGNGTVHGTIGNLPANLHCAPVSLAALETQLAASNDNSQIPLTDKGKQALGGSGGRHFTLSGNDGITLPAGTYFFSSISISGNSKIRLDGRVNILVKGATSISGGGVIRQLGNVFQLRLWSRGTVAISSQALFQGFFYAPENSLTISGGATIEGTLFAKSIALSGNVNVRRWVDDGPPTIALSAPAEQQVVAGCSVTVAGQVMDAEENGLSLTINGAPVTLGVGGSFSTVVALGGADPTLIAIEATDGDGTTTQLLRRVQITPPALTLGTPAPGSLVGARLIDLAGAAGYATAVTVDGQPATLAGGNWQLAGFDLGADGPKTLSLAATYCAGTVNATAALELDTAAPVLAIDSPLPGDLSGVTPIVVTGTIDEAHLASLTVQGVAATVENGRFTATVPLTGGVNTLTAVATDALGRSASASVAVELDQTAPTVAIESPASGVVVGTASAVVSGSVSDANLVGVTIGGQPATLSAGAFTITVPLVEGDNTLVATARDLAGNSTDSPAIVLVLDTQAPTVAIAAAELPALTAAGELAVLGEAVDPHLQEVLVNGVAATLTGSAFAATVPLAEGANVLEAVARDVLAASLPGHATTSAPVTVVRDATPPWVTIAEPAAGVLLASRQADVRGTAMDAHLREVVVNGAAATLAGAAFERLGVELAEGEQLLYVRAVDQLDQATEAQVAITVDSLAPELTVAAPIDGALVTTPEVTVSGSVADPHLETVTVNGVPATVADGAFSATVALEGSPATITVVALDLAGHRTERTLDVLREARPPAISLDPLPVAACSPGGVLATVGGSYQDDEAAAPTITLEVRAPGQPSRSYAATVADGRFTVAAVDLGLVDGLVTLVAQAVDAGGAEGQAAATVLVDVSAPRLVLTVDGSPYAGAGAGETPPVGAGPALFGRQVSFGALVEDGAAGTPPVAALTLDGAPYPAGAAITAAGTHLVVARVVDCAGRAVATHAYFELDRTPPRLLSTSPADGAELSAGIAAYGGTSDPDLAGATVDGKPATVTAGTFSLSPYPWREGDNTVSIELVDRAGLRSTFRRTFHVASLALELRLVEGGLPIAPNQLFTRPIAPQALVGGGTATVVLTLDGAPYVAGTPIAIPGSHTLHATATDPRGRTASATATFRLDLSPAPTIAVTEPADASTVPGPTVDVRGQVTGSAPTVTVNGQAATVNGGSFELLGYPLAEGELTFLEAVVRDAAGRQATAQVAVLRQPAGQAVLILDPADGTVTNRDRIDVAGSVIGSVSDFPEGNVLVGGGAAAPVAAPLAADGSFRARDVLLAGGENALWAEARDRFGRVSRATVHVFRDLQPPSIAIAANGSALADAATFAGAVELAVTLGDDSGDLEGGSVRLNGQALSPGGDGVYRLTLDADGGYLLSVLARDGAGNEARAERSFLIDRGGCRLSDVDPPAGSAIAAAEVTLFGRSGDAVTLRVRVPSGSGAQEFAADLADGTFLAAGVPLPQLGDLAIELVCVDAAGRTEVVAHPLRRVASGQGPTIDIQSPADGAVLGVDRVAIAGIYSAGTSASVTVNGATATTGAGNPSTFGLAQLALSEGPNIVAARVVDGGQSAADRVVVRRDSQAPKVAITSPENGNTVGIPGAGPASIDVTGRVDIDDEPNLTGVVVSTAQGSVTATLDPSTGSFTALAVPLSASVAAGVPQTVTVTATDSLGHQGQAKADVYLDPTGPAIKISAPADLTRYPAGSPAQVAVTGEVWAADGAVVSLNGGALPALAWSAPAADGRRHATFGASIPLPTRDGVFGVIARVVDPDQRAAQTRRLLQRDFAAPTVVELLPADGSANVDPDTLLLALFSEPIDRASLPGGLVLWRVATSQSQALSFDVAGAAVAAIPAVALAAGESYELRATTGIEDPAGQPLAAAVVARFMVRDSSLAARPTLDPLPAVVCADDVTIAGQAAAGAVVKVRDGGLTFSGNAGADGRFAIRLPLASNGYHHVAVSVVDGASGAEGPAATATFRVDCSAPLVRSAALDRATGALSLRFSEAVDAATLTVGDASAAIKLRDAEDPASPYYAGSLQQVESTLFTVQLDPGLDAWWRERPVRLQVGAPAADLRGNAMATVFELVFFPGSDGGLAGGFLFGEAWDDATGRPLGGATASLYANAAGQGAPLFQATTDGRGRYTLTGEVLAGRYAVLVEKAGYAPVVRRLALEPAKGAVPFDARLTPRAETLGVLAPAAGGRLANAGWAFDAAPAALPGSDELAVRLTPLTGQGLPDFLPLGWTPAVAAELRLESAPGVAVDGAFAAGNVEVDLPLPAWVQPSDALVAVAYDLATGVWQVLGDPERLESGGVAVGRLAPSGPGAVALVWADPAAGMPPAVVGGVLEGMEAPAETPELTATLTLDPPVVTPTGRSTARVVVRAADGVTAWPAGLAVQAFLEEKLILAGGQGQVLEAPFVADLVLYHPRLSAEEQGSNLPGSAGAASFVVSPSPRAAQVLLEVGYEKIRLYPFPEEVERGQIVGPTGGTVGDPAGVEVTVPEGALSTSIAVEAELLSAAELAELPAVAGFTTLAAVRLDFQGKELARPATLRLPAPAATPAEIAGDPRLVLGELVAQPADVRGAFPRLAARIARQGSGAGQRLVAAPETEAALALDGVVREGLYLVLHANQPLGFATGFVRGGGTTIHQHARVAAAPLGTADLSRLSGRYAVPVAAGAARPLEALHPITDERAAATVDVAAGQIVAIDLTLAPTPPVVTGVQPQGGAVDQPTGSAVVVQFSEAIDPASAGSGTLRLELLDGAGNGSGVYATGRVRVLGNQVRFESERPLLPSRTWLARFAGGVRDLQGTFYAGPAPIEWRFTTSAQVAPGGQVVAEKFHVELPNAQGVARLWAEPGALPLAQGSQAAWTVAPYAVGPWPGRDPLRPSIPARLDGGLETTVGRAGYPVTLASAIWVVVLDPTGQVAAEFEVGPYATADGRGFVARPGREESFRTADGVVVDVPAGAFDEPKLVQLHLRPLATPGVEIPQGLGIGAVVDLDFAGEARETLRVHVPAPAGVASDAQVFVGKARNLAWGQRIQFVTFGGVLDRDGEKFLSNDPSLQLEPVIETSNASGGMVVATALSETGDGGAESDDMGPWEGENPPRTCADVKRRGLGRCFSQALLQEFTVRQMAVFYYELGAYWGLGVGSAGAIVLGQGMQTEAFLNKIADLFVYLPRPTDSPPGLWILPILIDEPLVIQRRDIATGWVLAERAYDPFPAGSGDGVTILDPVGGQDAGPPMLLAAAPFEILRFAALEPGTEMALRPDLKTVTDAQGLAWLESVAGMPFADLTWLQVFDVAALAEADPIARHVVAGEQKVLCGQMSGWRLPAFTSRDQIVVRASGDLEARELDEFRFTFDRALDRKALVPGVTAKLIDLGPATGCEIGHAAGYPREIPSELDMDAEGRELVVLPIGVIPAGHRFELELRREDLITEGADGQPFYWHQAPALFRFATRPVAGKPVGRLDPDSFPIELGARDLLRFGNLTVVGTLSGDILAFDTTAALTSDLPSPPGTPEGSLGESQEMGLKPHSRLSSSAPGVRTFATDGHNRLFYSSLFGGTWAIKTLRIEDVRSGARICGADGYPEWSADLRCFDTVLGSIRIARMAAGAVSVEEFLQDGQLPAGTPSDFEVLSRDEPGKALELTSFVETYLDAGISTLAPDAEGIYTFDLPLTSTQRRYEDERNEPSMPADFIWEDFEQRVSPCSGDASYDRYQRVTVDNLTLGQSWSVDLENRWPGNPNPSADGTGILRGVKARRGDVLQVRYNLSAYGYVSILGSGITAVDLNRAYGVPQPAQVAGNGQCGRYLGRFEGGSLDYPECAGNRSNEGIRMTPALEVHSETGCGGVGGCRGAGRIDSYSPLMGLGAFHARAMSERPGYLQAGELAACIRSVDEQNANPLDVALANDVVWVDRGYRGDLDGNFYQLPDFSPVEKRGDLLFLALANAGVMVFDVSDRVLKPENVIGVLRVDGQTGQRLQYDSLRGILLVGGVDTSTPGSSEPTISLWRIRDVNGGGAQDPAAPRPFATIATPWTTRHLALDQAGTGLLYTWDAGRGLVAIPYAQPEFVLSGLYLDASSVPAGGEPDPQRLYPSVQRISQAFAPLGVPLREVHKDDGLLTLAQRQELEVDATAAFKVRISLPGSLGEEISAKVQSLRALPSELLLGAENAGPIRALPGGPGWPSTEVSIRLRRVGVGAEESASETAINGPGGRFDTSYNLYESVETVLLIADPRASRTYHPQALPDDHTDDRVNRADEEAQCRNCVWPSYLPNPKTAAPNDPILRDVKELLAGGRYLRVFLSVDQQATAPIREQTARALQFFAQQGANYELPTGWARVAAPADMVPSPIQASLTEPALSPALWTPNEAGVAVALTSGDLLLSATDHRVPGRGQSFTLDRHYRSGALGYGPLGSAGWTSPLFAHIREIESTGDAELHDGKGQVYRFAALGGEGPPPGYEKDVSTYYAPEGVYLRLFKLTTGGWRLLGPQNDAMLFDREGRLIEIGDRLRRAAPAGRQGNAFQLFYDAYGQLKRVEDDLGRDFTFEYFEDPAEARYGLLDKVTDFAGRTIEYDYAASRALTKVRLPEVRNEAPAFGEFSFEGAGRPTLEYLYGPSVNVTSSATNTSAVLHGEFAQLRLAGLVLPRAEEDPAVPRVRFEYGAATGRLTQVAFPDANGANTPSTGVRYAIEDPAGATDAKPPAAMRIRYPWGHTLDYELEAGRIATLEEMLPIAQTDGSNLVLPALTRYHHRPDGRLARAEFPNGTTQTICYSDSTDPGCPPPTDLCGGGTALGCSDERPPARIARLNALKTAHVVDADQRGLAAYDTIATETVFGEDNQVVGFTDGEGHATQLPLRMPGASAHLRYSESGAVGQGEPQPIGFEVEYDAYGRVTEQKGNAGEERRFRFGADHQDREALGHPVRIETGQAGQPRQWEEVQYDGYYNVRRRETSQGQVTNLRYDSWDRAFQVKTGASDGRLRPLGSAGCTLGAEYQEENAWDAAGHLVRTRRLQDYVDGDGADRCRWVETRYQYNAREQLEAVESSHVADPAQPGQVLSGMTQSLRLEYDEHGRLAREIRVNRVDAPLITSYRYDVAGRVAGVQVGAGSEGITGYDVAGRAVYRTDGDAAVWRGRYDGWNRLFHETSPTGSVTQRYFDKNSNVIRTLVWDKDPALYQDEKLLADTRAEYTSFGAVRRAAQVLTFDENDTPVLRVTETEFDASGRPVEVYSGPALPDSPALDRSQARREIGIKYEAETGRVLSRSIGGTPNGPPAAEERYRYQVENLAPWPDAVELWEFVPGEPSLVRTHTSELVRDAAGRQVEERRSSGEVFESIYDRGGEAIRLRDGAGTEVAVARDGGGRVVQHFRPEGRGSTRLAYDVDGRLLRTIASSAAGSPWQKTYHYDTTGRPVRVDFPDGSFESATYNTDGTVASQRTRDGIELTFGYDAANRLLAVTPAAEDALAPSLAPLDAGDRYEYDVASRLLAARRGSSGLPGLDPLAQVTSGGFDPGGRERLQSVGARGALSWQWDLYDRVAEAELPVGVGRSASGEFQGFRRQYDGLDRLTDVASIGALTPTASGATWTWGGVGRLFAMNTRGAQATSLRLGYLGGTGPQLPGSIGNEESAWQLGTLTWGGGSAAATATPAQVWGQLGFGWRGHDGAPQDGVKLGRLAVTAESGGGLDLFAGMGWSWSYDAGVRLNGAFGGRGTVDGTAQARPAEEYRYEYREGDELERIVRASAGEVTDLEVGMQGRIAKRGEAAFTYDASGRRTADDRFDYRWDWRGQLVSATVKATWPSPFAGEQIRYEYDALGRLSARTHWGHLPEGSTDEASRPFIERRAYLWDGVSLAAEAGYGDVGESELRWRKTYVPGPGGLDDAIQVAVEGGSVPGAKLYTYLRDELGTVIGLVAEEEGSDPAAPAIPVRYLYSPYGEAFVETGPYLRRARFDNDLTNVGGQSQQAVVPATHAPGALSAVLGSTLEPSTLAAGVVVEQKNGATWATVPASDWVVATASADPSEVQVLLHSGWQRGATYRVRLTSTLVDTLGRPYAIPEEMEWTVPATGAVAFDRRESITYESYAAARDTIGGRIPGGQTSLFQGLWTDPVTGIAYARARWYDARNAAWLSEDPLEDAESPNLYAFVGWQPHQRIDPLGERSLGDDSLGSLAGAVATGVAEGALDLVAAPIISAKRFVKDPEKWADSAIDGALNFLEHGNEIPAMLFDQLVDSDNRLEMLAYAGTQAALPAAGGKALSGLSRHKAPKGSGKAGQAAARLPRSAAAADEAVHATQAAKLTDGSRRKPNIAKHADADAKTQSRAGSRSSASNNPAESPTCLAAAVPQNCFVEGTVVATASGPKPIEKIQVGDLVWSVNEWTGEQVLGEVAATFTREVETVWVLEVGGQRLETTDEHPFFIHGKGYVAVSALEVGDEVLDAQGRLRRIELVDRQERSARVYNFEVRGQGNYFVGDGEVLVHNCIKPIKLTFDAVEHTWTSPQGLIYGLDNIHGNRILHVLSHGKPDPSGGLHTIFNVSRNKILALVDEAWSRRGAPEPTDASAYVVPMGRVVGTAGETSIRIIVRQGTSKIRTAYPVP